MMASRERSPTPSSEGAALPWILDHLMKYPRSYELPLRRMYELNSMANPQQPAGQKSPQYPLKTDRRPTRNAFDAPPSATHPPANEQNTQNATNLSDNEAILKANLMAEIASRPSQPCSLPPSFITSFVRGCLCADLDQVQFEQAMTALDYLKDLEKTRQRNYIDALAKLGISGQDDENGDLRARYPGVAKWLGEIKKKDRLALALYTQVYLRVRHWTLINEILTTPFNRANCTAMLNTLFPPVAVAPPTPFLSERTLKEHRTTFQKLIHEFRQRGPSALDPIVQRDMRQGDSTGWPTARDHIENYLRTANEMIDECFDVHRRRYSEEDLHKVENKGRKVDSGISFGTTERPSTSSSNVSGKPSVMASVEREPPSTGSTLERIAKEIRKIKSRPDLKQESKEKEKDVQKQQGATKTIKKVKSARFLRPRTKTSLDENEPFDVDHFRQKREEWEKSDQAKRASG